MNKNRKQWITIEGDHNLPDEDMVYQVELKDGNTHTLGFSHHNPSSVKYWLESVAKYFVE